MAVKTDSPQIAALKHTVEKRFGHPIEGRSDFSLLAMEIERITHEHIAENTLRRLWGKMSGYDTGLHIPARAYRTPRPHQRGASVLYSIGLLSRHLPVAAASVFKGEYLLNYVHFRVYWTQKVDTEKIF